MKEIPIFPDLFIAVGRLSGFENDKTFGSVNKRRNVSLEGEIMQQIC